MDTASAFIATTREEFGGLRDRLLTTLSRLSPEQLAWRPNAESNSAANLVLHVCGNLRQRFHAGFGGAPDDRARDEEFADRAPRSAEELSARAAAVFAEVDAFLDGLNPARLAVARSIQGRDQTLLEMLVHTLAHASEHVGQIVYIAKAHQGEAFAPLSIPLPKKRPSE